MSAVAKTAVLLVNLGTPNSPAPKDVYRYLIEFLTDERVIDKPWILRQALVRGLIVPLRYRQSAKAYSQIWLEEGSPLWVYSERAKRLLQENLGSDYIVELAMRYQNPSIEKALSSISKNAIDHLIVIPLFPQYASATTGSVHEKIFKLISKYQVLPKVTLIDHFATDPLYIETIAEIASSYDLTSYDHFLFSFHGLPKSHLVKANPTCSPSENCCPEVCSKNTQGCYLKQCHQTANAIAKKLGLNKGSYSICFQSRLGKEPWIEPFTLDTIKNLRKSGANKLLVFCPSFVADCLETIYEIGIEYASEFKHLGGKALDYVVSLNDHPKWIETLKSLVLNATRK